MYLILKQYKNLLSRDMPEATTFSCYCESDPVVVFNLLKEEGIQVYKLDSLKKVTKINIKTSEVLAGGRRR